jgi:Tol biopolymer transport system component
MSLDDPVVTRIAELPTRHYDCPRWSPDGKQIAFQQGDGFRSEVHVVGAVAASKPVAITHESKVIRGLAWLPDGSGVVYATSRGSTFPYLPPLSLWEARLDGRQRQLTSPEASYEQPDVHKSGTVSVSRVRMDHDIWAYPFDGAVSTPGRGRQVTRQTGEVLTPTVSPDGRDVAYLSDEGGHGNVWIKSAADPARQITFENDPNVTIGVPAWSPDGRWIAYVSSKGNVGLVFGIWLIHPDGSENHQLVPKGISPTWSEDDQWVYYVEAPNSQILRVPASGGDPEPVRSEPARNIIGVDGSTVYYVVDRALMDGRKQVEFRAAPHGDGPARTILTVPESRVPPWQVANPSLSPDGRWLAMPLTDGFTTNVWAISTEDGRVRRVTDFGDRATFIARRVSWSSDGRSILAAIGEGDADIAMLDGLIPDARK